MKKHVTKKTWLLTLVSLALCLSLFAGSTFAWFTDTVASGNNLIRTGTLDVQLEYLADGQWQTVDHTTTLFDREALWEPGHTEVAYLRISNAGTLALQYQLGIHIAAETGSVNVHGESFMLSDYLSFGVLPNVSTPFATRAAAREAVRAPLALTQGYAEQNPLLPGADAKYMALVVYMPETVGNEANHDRSAQPPRIELGLALTATQYMHEEDSFDKEYDAFAQFPKTALDVSVATPVQDKAANGVLTSPVNVGNSGTGVTAQVPQGVALEDNATALTLSVKTMDESNANITLADDQVAASVDVHIAGVAQSNTVPMTVRLEKYLPVGLNNGSLALYHVENGAPVAMTQVAEPTAHNEFSYDPLTGTVTLALASFSEVAIVADTNNPWDGKSDTAFAGGSGTEADPYLIANAGQMAYFRDLVDGGETFAGKFVTLANTIELSGVNFDPIGWGYDYAGYTPGGKTFQGTFDGNHFSILGLYQEGDQLEAATGTDYSNSMAGGGLFASAVDATFRNVHISGADIKMNCVDMGILVGYSQGNCTYDHIRIYNSKIANYQRATGGVIGEVGPRRDANGKPVYATSTHTLRDVVIGNNVVVGSRWGDFDAPVGGVIGARWDDTNTTAVVMDNVTVGCRLDVYNDITAAYRWHAYRRAGMLIGNTDIPAADGRTAQWAQAPFLTCNDVTVELGDWVNYQYCQFTNEQNPGRNYPWVRVEAGENCPAYSNPRYGHPVDNAGNTVTNDIHSHLPGDQCRVLIPFAQLYGGGQGVYGVNAHPGVNVVTPVYTIAYMDGTEVLEVIYVTDNKVPYTNLRAVESNEQWLDGLGNPVTQIPAGNTKNVVLHLDDKDKLIAHFVDVNGMEIYAEQFTRGQKELQHVPEVPKVEGYNGHWEPYTLSEATASIVINPVYTVEEGYSDLMDLNKLFELISDGKNVVMPHRLAGGQSNAGKKTCCVVTTNEADPNARLNLNGGELHYNFDANGNQRWLIFDIRDGASLDISGGVYHGGTLFMDITTLHQSASAIMFDLDPEATLVLEKGAIIRLSYPQGRAEDVSMFGLSGTQFGLNQADFPYLEYYHDEENCEKVLIVRETTVIHGTGK